MDHPQEDLYRLRQFIRNQFVDRLVAGRLEIYQPLKFIDSSAVLFDSKQMAVLQPDDNTHRSFPDLRVQVPDIVQIKNWRMDPSTGRTSPVGFVGTLNPQDYEIMGDIKYAAVLSRLHFLPFFAINGVAHEKNESLEQVEEILRDWETQNPYLKTINWKFGIEVGIRSLNLVLTRKVLSLGKNLERVNQRIDRLVSLSYRYLEQHPSLYSSANNHRVAEVLGMIVIAAHYDVPDRRASLNRLGNEYFSLLHSQQHPDGGNREQSIQYHIEMLDAFIIGFHLLRHADVSINWEAVSERLTLMGEFLTNFIDGNGHKLSIGDDDEGHYIYPYHRNYHEVDSVMASLELYTNGGWASPRPADCDLRCYLIGGQDWLQKETSPRTQKPREKSSCLFQHSGYAIFSFPDHRLIFDIGEIGLPPMAAHGHSDILAFTLDYEDTPFIVDPGTYQYHGRTPYRQYFRSVHAHNTLSVGGLDQAKSGGRMIWHQLPSVRLLEADLESDNPVVTAEHDGFRRQGLGVIHRRSITYDKKGRTYTIKDILIGETREVITSYLHIHPDVEVERSSNNTVTLRGARASICLESEALTQAEILSGNESPIAGWYSPRYDERVPCTTLKMTLTAEQLTAGLTTRLVLT